VHRVGNSSAAASVLQAFSLLSERHIRKNCSGKLAKFCDNFKIDCFTCKVTGGARGIGREICLELAKHGCTVAIADINLLSAEATANDLRSAGGKARAYKVDVSKSDEIIKLRDDVRKDLGCVDILVSY
jgi:hypothetical protein